LVNRTDAKAPPRDLASPLDAPNTGAAIAWE
jgi:hypothetical protein